MQGGSRQGGFAGSLPGFILRLLQSFQSSLERHKLQGQVEGASRVFFHLNSSQEGAGHCCRKCLEGPSGVASPLLPIPVGAVSNS